MQTNQEINERLVMNEFAYFGSILGMFHISLDIPREEAIKFMAELTDLTKKIADDESFVVIPRNDDKFRELLIARLKFTLAELEKLHAASNKRAGD